MQHMQTIYKDMQLKRHTEVRQHFRKSSWHRVEQTMNIGMDEKLNAKKKTLTGHC